jgi:hypothetical protein
MYLFRTLGNTLNKKHGGFSMDNKFMNSLKPLDYANLSETQENRLRELEKQFNNEFGTSLYFMVMENPHKN